jgi:hypothetical protein
MSKKDEAIYIQVGEERIELTGEAKESFLVDRQATADAKAILEAEAEAKKQARIDAITKLGQASGLTTEEIESILNI